MRARMSILEGSRPDRRGAALRSREHSTAATSNRERVRGNGCPRRAPDRQDTGNTFWEREESLRASEEAANRMREDSAEAMSDTIAGVERYEVGFFEMSS